MRTHIYRFIVALWFNNFIETRFFLFGRHEQCTDFPTVSLLRSWESVWFTLRCVNVSKQHRSIIVIIVVIVVIRFNQYYTEYATEHSSSFLLLSFNNWHNALLFDRICSEFRLFHFVLAFLVFFCFIWYPKYFTMALIHYLNHSIFTFSMPISDDIANTYARTASTPFLFKHILNLFTSHLRTIERG